METLTEKVNQTGKIDGERKFIILYRFICDNCDKTIYSEEKKTFWWCPRCNLFLAQTGEDGIKIFRKLN